MLLPKANACVLAILTSTGPGSNLGFEILMSSQIILLGMPCKEPLPKKMNYLSILSIQNDITKSSSYEEHADQRAFSQKL